MLKTPISARVSQALQCPTMPFFRVHSHFTRLCVNLYDTPIHGTFKSIFLHPCTSACAIGVHWAATLLYLFVKYFCLCSCDTPLGRCHCGATRTMLYHAHCVCCILLALLWHHIMPTHCVNLWCAIWAPVSTFIVNSTCRHWMAGSF